MSDYERLTTTLAGWHWLASIVIMLKQAFGWESQ